MTNWSSLAELAFVHTSVGKPPNDKNALSSFEFNADMDFGVNP